MSLATLGFAFATTLSALFSGKTTNWNGVPSAVGVVVFFVLMCFVVMMEGMQIAMFAVVDMHEEKLHHDSIAYGNCQLTFLGSNFQAFLIGRQICVTVCLLKRSQRRTLMSNRYRSSVSCGGQESGRLVGRAGRSISSTRAKNEVQQAAKQAAILSPRFF